MATHSPHLLYFNLHLLYFSLLVIFRTKNIEWCHKLELHCNIFICLLDHTYEAPLANNKMDCQRWPEKPLILGRSGNQYVTMVTELLSLYCGAHLVESYCKESNISDTNWLRYLSTYQVYDVINWWISIFQQLEYLWNEKRYLKIVKSIFLLIETSFYVLKWRWLERCDFHHSTTLKNLFCWLKKITHSVTKI